MRMASIGLLMMLAVASCGDSTPTESTDSSSAADTPQSEDVAPAAPSVPVEVEVTSDVAYGNDRGEGYHPARLDVYAPVVTADETAPDSWPVVVMFHGTGGQAQDKSSPFMTEIASLTASQGAVVFAPSTGGPSADPNSRDLRILEDAGQSCATSFVVDTAAEYGGDSDRLTLAGFSGGANAAASVALADSPPGAEHCLVPPAPVEPDALVLWEGDYLLAPWWDDAIESDPSILDDWIWPRINPETTSTWHLMLGDPDRVAPQRLPVGDPFGEGDECDRALGPDEPGIQAAGGMCRYFELRDAAGDLRQDADELGHFDDGFFTIGEFSLLLDRRLEAAGVETTTTIVEGATHSDLTEEGRSKMVELIIDGDTS